MEYRDYYATLGVPRTATQTDIKKQFRKLARQHHPDVNKGDASAEQRFKEISEANEVLSDPDKRKLYDQLGSNWQAYQGGAGPQPAGGGRAGGSPFGGTGGFNPGSGGVRFEYSGNAEDLAGFSDFFRTFFGAGLDPNDLAGAHRGRTQTRTSAGSIEDLFGGGQYTTFTADGGRSSGGRAAPTRAPQRIEADAEVVLDEVMTGTKRLLDIDGRRLEVNVPAGVADGQRIRFSKVADGADAYIKVMVKPHPEFSRDGANLHREIPVTLREALLGGEVAVRTLSGRLMLRIPPETQNGRVFRLAGQGLPHFRKEGRGDLYAKVRVVLPQKLSDEARVAAARFLDLADEPQRHGAAPTDQPA